MTEAKTVTSPATQFHDGTEPGGALATSWTLEAIERVLPRLRLGPVPAVCTAMMAASRASNRLGRADEALGYSQEALSRLDDSCTARMASVLRNVHGANLIQLGRFAEALDVLDRAAFDARKSDGTDLIALVLVNRGSVVATMGDHASAIELFLEARRLAADDRRATTTRTLAQSNLAAAWLMAATRAEASGDPSLWVTPARAALDAARVAMDELRAGSDFRSRIVTLHTLVRACAMLDDIDPAETEFDVLVDHLPAQYLQDLTFRAIRAQLLLASGRNEAARFALSTITDEQALAASPELHEHVLTMLVLVYERAGQWTQALATQKQLTALFARGCGKVAHEQFRQFRQMRFSRSDDAVAFLAHDLRAMLGSVIATAAGPPSAEASARTAASARRALSLTDRFLAMARLEQVQARSFEPVELGGLLDDVCESLGPMAEQAGKRLVSSLDFGHYSSGHRESLERAATNLIENALRATPEGGTVTVALELGAEGIASMVIRDQGPGLAPEHQAMLTGGEGGGGSLVGGRFGLAIVAQVARLHGIRIRVSAASTGTCVALDLARCTAPGSDVDAPAGAGMNEVAGAG